MTSNPVRESRSPISRLFAAALDGDPRATRVLHALADDDATASPEDAVDAGRALRALGESRRGASSEDHDVLEGQRRVWATGYVDQLLARYRDAVAAEASHPVGVSAGSAADGQSWMVGVSGWPSVGDRVLVWAERAPSRTPRDPHEATVDHVAGLTFTVSGLDATFNRSTGRSNPVRRGAGAFASTTYVAVDADSERAHQVLDTANRRDRDTEATQAVHAWLADRSPTNRRAAIEALRAIEDL